MSDDDLSFDPEALPRVAMADPNLPGRLELGAGSILLAVADLAWLRGALYATLHSPP